MVYQDDGRFSVAQFSRDSLMSRDLVDRHKYASVLLISSDHVVNYLAMNTTLCFNKLPNFETV